MTPDTGSDESMKPSPDEAFAVLGSEARLEIMQTLGETGKPLAYSELFERLSYNDRSNFSYHLKKLVGHFVGKVDDEYVLRRPGERVVEAVLSGAVTADPVRELTETERPCPFCSASIEVGYQQERVTMHCPECSGLFGEEQTEDDRFTQAGNLGFRPLPPAATTGRTAEEIHDVSKIWVVTSMQAIGRGVCPRCSGTVDHSVEVCESHDASEGVCDRCGLRFGAMALGTCENCVLDMQVGVAALLGVYTELLAFMIDHGIDPIVQEGFHLYAAAEERILSTDPFEAEYTFTIGDETLKVNVDASLSIVEATKGPTGEAQ